MENYDEIAKKTKNINVLIVEDDEISSILLERLIRRFFANIYIAQGAQQGIELFKFHHPELIISDINMPDMDGFEMIKALKPEFSDKTKVIFLSGSSSGKTLNKIKEIGAHLIIKPFILEKFIQLLSKLYL